MARMNALLFLGLSGAFLALIFYFAALDVMSMIGLRAEPDHPAWSYALLTLVAAAMYARALSARRDYWKLSARTEARV
jgi:hypothetical protein